MRKVIILSGHYSLRQDNPSFYIFGLQVCMYDGSLATGTPAMECIFDKIILTFNLIASRSLVWITVQGLRDITSWACIGAVTTTVITLVNIRRLAAGCQSISDPAFLMLILSFVYEYKEGVRYHMLHHRLLVPGYHQSSKSQFTNNVIDWLNIFISSFLTST